MSKVDAEAERIYDQLGRGEPTDVKTIKAALLAAEKRGEERERERRGSRSLNYSDISVPSDIQEFGERHGIPTFADVTYRNGYMDGYRAAIRSGT
jgi:hypothetical protein